MGPSQTVMVFIEVHHLHPFELLRNFVNLFLLARLLMFDAFGIPLLTLHISGRPVKTITSTYHRTYLSDILTEIGLEI